MHSMMRPAGIAEPMLSGLLSSKGSRMQRPTVILFLASSGDRIRTIAARPILLQDPTKEINYPSFSES
jgi:hypothetical protein